MSEPGRSRAVIASIGGVPVINRIFVSSDDGEFILAQWKVLAATFAITEKTDGKKLANGLRKLALADNPAVVEQIITLERELARLEANIAQQEAETNSVVYRLYGLTERDIALIEKDKRVGNVPSASSP
jgi:hypothetical protein